MTTHKVLSKAYDLVQTLGDYAVSLVPSAHIQLIDDPDSFIDLLANCLVTKNRISPSPEPEYGYYEPQQTQYDLIKRVQLKLLKSRERTNVLNLGFRLADERDAHSRDQVVNYAVNTNVELLRTSDWRLLLQRIGEGPMFHILATCSIFIPVGNSCYVQIAGIPASDVVGQHQIKTRPTRKRSGEDATDSEGRPKKRVRGAPEGTKSLLVVMLDDSARSASLTITNPRNSPADIPILRNRMFYTRPQTTRSGNVHLGLPTSHALYKIEPDRTSSDSPESITKKLEAAARHLSKYVFPRQYDLANAFTSPKDKKSLYPFADHADREDDILIKGPCKTPKRIKPILPLLQKLVRLHERTAYSKLCDITCPTKLKAGNRAGFLEPNAILQDVASELSQQLFTQAVNVTVGDISVDISRGSIIVPQAKSKPRFAEYACSHTEVYRFVAMVLMTVIPRGLWGGQSNMKVILKHIATFIACRRAETLTLHYVMQGFNITDCEWLKLSAADRSSTISDDLKRREILNEFIYWLFESFVSPLLKGTFYVTESSAFRNQVLYFRQDDWTKLCAPLLDGLSERTFKKLPLDMLQAQNAMKSRQLGYSFIRLLPKETGVRPIVNLTRKPKTGQSINRVLQNAFQILTFEKANQPDLLGASVFGLNEVYAQLKAFRKRVLLPDRTMPKLYFVKVDVRAAFDTIDQDKLVGILHDLLSEDDYNVRRWAQVVPTSTTAGGAKRSYHKKAQPLCDEPQFSKYASKMAKVMRNAIFVDQVTYSTAEKDDILRLLEEHIKQNLVKIGPHFYQQMIGIPQGSVLSTLLCSFFYGDSERKKINFRDDPRNLLVRFVDDYLFITTRLSVARIFLDQMAQGHPEYGCLISPEKTLTNFDANEHRATVTPPSQKDFPWCGVRINMEKLSVQADYHRLHDIHVSATLTVNRGRRPGESFRQKMIHASKLRNHVIYNDTSLNGRKVVYINVYQNFLVTAMKMHDYLKSWGASVRWQFILETILTCIRCGYASTRKKVTEKLARESKASFAIQRTSFFWLGLKAFHLVFARKRTAFTLLVVALEKQLADRAYTPGTKEQMARMKAIMRDGSLVELRY